MTADQERQRRAKAARQAKASLHIDGLDRGDPAADAVMDRWINGDLTGDEALQAMTQLPLAGSGDAT